MSAPAPAEAGTGQELSGSDPNDSGSKPRRGAFLFDGARRELEFDSGIDPAVIAERGYRSIGRPTPGNDEPRRELKRLGIPTWAISDDADFPGLLIPTHGPTGQLASFQWKPRRPVRNREGKPFKYASRKGAPNRLDVHPRWCRSMSDPTVPLYVTEGVKKADAMTSRGLCTIALTGVYNWRSQLGTLGEWEDVALKGRIVSIVFDNDANTNRTVARAMARFGKWLGSRGARVQYIVVPSHIGDITVKGADDFFAAGGSVEQLVVHAKNAAPDLDNSDDTFTDSRIAEAVAEDVLTGRFVWLAGMGWLNWNGCVWNACSDATVGEAVRLWVVDQFAEASARLAAGHGDRERVKGWLGMQSVGRQRAVISLARGIVEGNVTELDGDPDLLNTLNGVVDLRTGELMPHDPDLMMTKIAGAAFEPGATHPDWVQALEAVPDEVRDWYQLRMGQALTGHMPPDDLLVISQGSGENGKSTVNDATARAAGSYFLLASHRLLIASPDQHPTELMDLQGVRYAVAEETPEARRLSTTRLKQAVGTPQITARKIAKDSVTFDATHSLFLSTNYAPMVEETDHGTWRRLALLRFPFTFRKASEPLTSPNDRRGDPGLRRRLATDPAATSAVLAWMVEGARRWYEHEDAQVLPALPDRIAADTRGWRGESDQVLAYVSERLVFSPGRHVMASDLLADFNTWLTERGHRAWSDRTLSTRFGDHDEVTRHAVTKGKPRKSPTSGLSRANRYPPTPAQYSAWMGVRFATDLSGAGAVTGVTATPDGRESEIPDTRTEMPSHPSRPVGAGT